MKNQPLVSVLIPSYNHAQYIEQAIQSVYDQDYPNIELIVNDDGSSDNTHEVLSKYIDRPNTTIILNKKNRGQSVVFNEAIDLAKGDFISILPSDDWYLPAKTRLQVEKFRTVSDKVGVVYGSGERFFEDTGETHPVTEKKYRGYVLPQMLSEPFFVYPITPMFRKECFEKVRFDESYTAEGEALYAKLAIYFEYDYVDDVLGVMRDHSYNIGKNTDLMFKENLRYWTSFFELPDLPEDVKPLRAVRLGKLYRTKGLEKVMLRGEGSVGRGLLKQCLKTNSAYRSDPKVWIAIGLSFLPSSLVTRIGQKNNA